VAGLCSSQAIVIDVSSTSISSSIIGDEELPLRKIETIIVKKEIKKNTPTNMEVID
jgi:hypothetical protein